MEPETDPVIPCGYGEVALVNWKKLHCSPALEGLGPRASGGITLMLILGWSALTTSGRLHGAIPRPRAQGANERALEPPEWIAHEAARVRLGGGPALVRGCLERRKGVGNGPVTTGTGGRKLHGVRGTAGCLGPRLAAGLGLHYLLPGRKPPQLGTNRSDTIRLLVDLLVVNPSCRIGA